MREIKFRGKDVAGEWHQGLLTVLPKSVRMLQKGSYISNDDGLPFAYQVRPETVGQYTGLLDKNGQEIYEGDILQCSLPVEIIENGCPALDFETVFAKVVFHEGSFMAEAKTAEYPWVLDGDRTILSWLSMIDDNGKHKCIMQVIGNVFENPELLEV